jgi:two-component system sensor kinase FixL
MSTADPHPAVANLGPIIENSLALLNAAPDAMVVVDAEGTIVLANPRTEKLFGYSNEELIGGSVELLVPDRVRERHRAHRDEFIGSPHVRPMGTIADLIGRRKDGSEFPVDIALSPLMLESGKLIVTAIRDVTARREAERRLRDEKRFSDAVIDSLPGLFCMLDEQGRYVRWNKNTEAVLGYSAEELAGRTRTELVNPSDAVRVAEAARVAFHAGGGSCEYENVTKDGRSIPFLCHGVTIEIDGRPYLLCVEMDVSERRRMEAALRESEARYRGVAETAMAAIITADGEGRITYANPATVELFGYATEELIGEPLTMLMPVRLRPRFSAALERFLKTGIPGTPRRGLVMTGGHRSGREMPIEASLGFLRQRDGKGFFTVITHDISNRIRTEMELEQQRRELAHVMRVATMGEMAAGLAHEVNQPLAAIAAYARGAAVRIKAGKVTQEELAEVVERIAEDAHRAGEIIRRLRQFVKKRTTAAAAIDVNQLAGEVCRFVAAEALQREVVLDLKLNGRLPKVTADAVEMQQVALNLVRNAFDAVAGQEPEQRRVVVRTRRSARGDVELVVDDSGPGISAGLKEQVFEPFFTSKEEGLGMGLTISRTLVESHGGRIWVRKSRLGGVSIRFSLPVTEVS